MVATKKGNVLLPKSDYIFKHIKVYFSSDASIFISEKALFRSSHQRCSIKRGVLKNVSKFTGKRLCQSLFFNKVAGLQLY